MKKVIFFLTWGVLLLIGPYTILSTTSIDIVTRNNAAVINLFQRLTGLILITLLTIQLTLGSFMSKFTDKFGGWVLRFHIVQGIAIYLLILLHPLLYVFFLLKIKGVLDPFYVFSDLCVICKGFNEHYINFGRIAFWIINIGVFAGLFRAYPILRKNWRKIHTLNYLAFFFVAAHSFKVGSDVQSTPFLWFYWLSIVWIACLVFYKLLTYFRNRA